MIQRAVYSLWTKPMNDTYVGFNSEEALMECFALSLHFSKKWFKEVHLVTDNKGKELIDKYGLEFTDVSTALEEGLADVDAAFQNTEAHTYHEFYGNMIDFDRDNYKTYPVWYTFPNNEEGQSFNCGVIAFNKIELVQEWWNEAIKYVKYLSDIGGYRDVKYNIPSVMFEQHFVASICKYYGLNIGMLTDYHEPSKSHYDHIDDELSEKLGYTHLIAQSKRQEYVEKKVKNAVKALGIELKNKL